jgi:alkylhydroperoxidase family enzyme
MPRVKEITNDGDDPILQVEFATERAMFGDVLHPTRVMAHCPPILRAAKRFYAAFDQSGQLPMALLALVYVRVATLNGCSF